MASIPSSSALPSPAPDLRAAPLADINNCGTAALALFSAGNPAYDRLAVAKLQATQVSIISVFNCSGRLLIGVATDVAKTKLHVRRIHFLSVVSLVFILSQLVAASTSDVTLLWITSSLCVRLLLLASLASCRS